MLPRVSGMVGRQLRRERRLDVFGVSSKWGSVETHGREG